MTHDKEYVFMVDEMDIGRLKCEELTYNMILTIREDFTERTGINVNITECKNLTLGVSGVKN